MEYLITLGNLLIIAGIPLSLAFWAGYRKGKSDTWKKWNESQEILKNYNCRYNQPPETHVDGN